MQAQPRIGTAWLPDQSLQSTSGAIASPSDIVYMEFEGLANDLSSPCATSGVVGGNGSVGPLVPGLVQ